MHLRSLTSSGSRRSGCIAQAVLHAWHEVVGDSGIKMADLKPFGAGRAPERQP